MLSTQAFMSFVEDAGRVGEMFPGHVSDPAALADMFKAMLSSYAKSDESQDAAEIQLFDWCVPGVARVCLCTRGL